MTAPSLPSAETIRGLRKQAERDLKELDTPELFQDEFSTLWGTYQMGPEELLALLDAADRCHAMEEALREIRKEIKPSEYKEDGLTMHETGPRRILDLVTKAMTQ